MTYLHNSHDAGERVRLYFLQSGGVQDSKKGVASDRSPVSFKMSSNCCQVPFVSVTRVARDSSCYRLAWG